jgi:hypothetical protein
MSKNKKEVLQSFYEEAISDETSVDRLEYIWNNTTSVRIRKAIASNPASSVKLLKEAARLYLEEVLSNASFELLAEFTTADEWVNEVYLARTNPRQFLLKTPTYKLTKKSDLCLAALYNENIDTQSLFDISNFASIEVLRRAAKNPRVKEGVNRQILNFIKHSDSNDESRVLNAVEISNFYLEGYITIDDLNNYLKGGTIFYTTIHRSLFHNLKKRIVKIITEDYYNKTCDIAKYAKTFLYLILSSRNFSSTHFSHEVPIVYDKRDKVYKINKEKSLIKTTQCMKLGLLLKRDLDTTITTLGSKYKNRINTRKGTVFKEWVSYYMRDWLRFFEHKNYKWADQNSILEDFYKFLKENALLLEFEQALSSVRNELNLQGQSPWEDIDSSGLRLSKETKQYFSDIKLIS